MMGPKLRMCLVCYFFLDQAWVLLYVVTMLSCSYTGLWMELGNNDTWFTSCSGILVVGN